LIESGAAAGESGARDGSAGRRRSGRGRGAGRGAYEIFLHCLYDLVYVGLFALVSPYVAFKLATESRFRAGLLQRLGFVSRRADSRRCLWIHGVSVGEILAASRFVREFEKRFPDWTVVLSTTTKTGRAAAARHFSGKPIFYYPLDLSIVVRRVIGRIRPDVVVLMELEIWPNFLLSTSRRGIKVLLLNGRIGERSYRGYRILQMLFPEPLRRIDLYCVQNGVYADRLARLGVPLDRIHVTGTMKYDTIETEEEASADATVKRDLGLSPRETVVVGGSTHPPEEEELLGAFSELRREIPDLRLVLAPRRPERIGEIADAVRRRGFVPLRRTEMPLGGPRIADPAAVVLIDTIGELSRIYRAASVVFIGGSLIPHGGQNMMEAAGLGKAVMFGPFVFNFQDSVEVLLRDRAAVQLRNADDLLPELRRLLGDASYREEMGRRARDAIRKNQGASQRNLEIIARHVIAAE